MDKKEIFESMLLKYKNVVKSFIFYKIPASEDAKDILQNVLIAAYESFDNLKEIEKFKPWILRIASNKCNDYFRKHLKSLEIPLRDIYSYEEGRDRAGITIKEVVNETLSNLKDK